VISYNFNNVVDAALLPAPSTNFEVSLTSTRKRTATSIPYCICMLFHLHACARPGWAAFYTRLFLSNHKTDMYSRLS